ncbi:hypothetical protein RhiXN_01478 [Rhizoctonia solani]|uniref:Uncharacterized protein n=1 Tax=Rhizoctonia solani TaxID=456999 RepID=A0A8H8P8S4_9AGAM|nr:uncharacterized protein RhiXN_01478 [Rhizoctonia solani]QRW26883.1 hypothetical protein RhiXN_01478 [Rhizoctonia solani]
MAAVLPVTPVVPSQPSPRRMPRRLTISIMNNPPNFSSLAPLSSPSSSSSSGSDDESPMPPPGLGGRRLSASRTSTPTPKVNPYAAGGALCELAEIAEPTVTPAPTARPRLLPQSTSFFVQSPAPTPARPASALPKKTNPYAAGGALSETPTPVPTPKPKSLEKPMSRPLNLRVLTARQIQDMAQAAQVAHNNQTLPEKALPRFGGVVGFGQPSSSPLRKLAFDESDVSDDSCSSDGGSAHSDWSSEEGSDSESLEEWERQLGDVSWFVDNGYD